MKRLFPFCAFIGCAIVLAGCESGPERPVAKVQASGVQTVPYLEPDAQGEIVIPPEGIIISGVKGLPAPKRQGEEDGE